MTYYTFYGKKFAEDIRNKRNELGLTQLKTASCLGIEPRTLQYVEYGRLPGTRVFLKLISFFGLTAGDYGEEVPPYGSVHTG